MEKVKRANAELAKVVREEKDQLRKVQDRHKYMMEAQISNTVPALLLCMKVLSGAPSVRQPMSPVCILRSRDKHLPRN